MAGRNLPTMQIEEHEPRTPSESLVFEVTQPGSFEAYFEAIEDSQAVELVDGNNAVTHKLRNAAYQLIRAKSLLNKVYDQNGDLIAEIRTGERYTGGGDDADD